MTRVEEEFPLECPGCGGDIRLIAFVMEPGPIWKIPTRIGSLLATRSDIKKKERPGSPKPLFLEPTSHYPDQARHAARSPHEAQFIVLGVG
jgi:hypothetical protein